MNIQFKSMLVILSAVLSLGLACLAQGSQPASSISASGPVDIQANEQEFAGDQVIAKGNVRVLYKDSIIRAPEATLFRDPTGNPQRAVFTGHPNLVQGKNLIDAETLMFDIVNSRVIADGKAHSEVESTAETAKSVDKTTPGVGGKAKTANPSASEKIVTDADHQEYDSGNEKFEAEGHVKVVHGDITVRSDKLQLVYGQDKKPETAIFNGHVVAQQNNTAADSMTYSLTTRRLQATGHVKSKVVQPKKDSSKKALKAMETNAAPGAAYAAQLHEVNPNQEDTIIITANSQDSSEDTGRMNAEGNVHVYYQDTVGIGPKVILLRNSEGRAERVLFVGRSQVSQMGRRWIADRIMITVADKKVLAQGNTRAMIIQNGAPKPETMPNLDNSRLANRAGAQNSLSARKVETPQ